MELLKNFVNAWNPVYEASRNDTGGVIQLASLSETLTPADCVVFVVLETLSILGLAGNACFLYVIFRFKLYQKPSYMLLLSLAVADIVHCLVMAGYFYPPIVTKMNPFTRMGSRIIMSIEWAAWGITLSHMAALAADRLVAVTCCYAYAKLVTPRSPASAAVTAFALLAWLILLALTVGLLIRGHCCLMIPVPGHFTFTFEDAPSETLNIYLKIFVPFESLTAVTVGVVTPLTLMRYLVLRRRLKRDRGASRFSLSKREGRVLLQIVVITLIFFLYMINYYLFTYILGLTDKWETMFNSLLYCLNSMVHPFIYFGFNRQLRKQLFDCRCCQQQQLQSRSHQGHQAVVQLNAVAPTSSPTFPWSERVVTRVSRWRHTLTKHSQQNSLRRPSRRAAFDDKLCRVRGQSFELAPLDSIKL